MLVGCAIVLEWCLEGFFRDNLVKKSCMPFLNTFDPLTISLQVKGRDHPVLGYSILGQGRSMLPGVCQLLLLVYQRLLQDHNTVNNPDLQRQALLVESNGPGCF